MKIEGLQTLTLLDYPGKVACTVFTGGCNLRCPFCHNAQLVLSAQAEPFMENAAFFRFLEKRARVLDGVCVTGGEPLLQPDLIPFLETVKSMGFTVKLDTNGFLTERLQETVQSGAVDYVAMDIKNAPARYGETVGVADFDVTSVQESVAYLMTCGVDYEFRTTVVRELHTAEDLLEIGRWLAGAKRYFLQNFQDSGALLGTGLHAYSEAELTALLQRVQQVLPCAALRGV